MARNRENAETSTCKECGHVATRLYCAHCGQKTSTARLNMESLLLQAVDVALHATRRAAFTIYELFFRPSDTTKSYLDGRRQSYQSPVAVFTLGYLLLYVVIKFVKTTGGAPALNSTLTALEKPTVFLGMCIIAFVSHFVVAHPKLHLAETLAGFLYVYGSAFVFALPFVIGAALKSRELDVYLQQWRFLAVDGPVVAFIIVQAIRTSTFVNPSRARIAAAVAFGVSCFLLFRFGFNLR